MKILKINFKNINNLKGENIISFEDEPLQSSGIFAITGPTGSGKSTILDVITLALFNKIPRFKGVITKTSIEGLGSVVTHHTDEASASITYEIHNQKYTSTWTVGKTRAGKFKDYEMFIYDVNGTPLDLKKSEVPSKNEEIIGLKYDQFVKSIILSQGQFSKFLKADKSERGQLLENLTGSSIYRKISIAAYEKYKVVKDEVALEKDRLEHIQILSDEDRIELSALIKSNDAEKLVLDTDLEKLNIAKQVKSEIEKTSSKLELKRTEKELLLKEKIQYKDKLAQLDLFEKLSPIVGELTRYRDAKSNFNKLTINISSNTKLYEEAELSRKSAMDKMSELTKSDINIENFSEVMSSFEKEINALDQEILHIGKSGRETRQRINSKAARYNIEIDTKAGPDSTIPQLKKKIESCDILVKKAGLDSTVELDEVNKSHSGFTEELLLLKELNHAYEHEKILKEKVEKSAIELLKYVEEEKKHIPLVSTSQQLVISTKQNIELLEKQRQDALLIAKLTDHRNQLVDGDPCPLCGALDHPFTDHAPQENSGLSLDIQKAKEKLKEHENEYAGYNRKLTESQTSKVLIEDQIKVNNSELENAKLEKQSKYSAYEGSASKEEKDIIGSIEMVELKIDQFSQVIKALESRSILNELVIDFDELSVILKQYGKLANERKIKYSGENVSGDCNLLQDQFVSYNTQIATLTTLISNDKKALEQIGDYIETTVVKLEPQVKEMGFESLEATTSAMISEEELQQLKTKKEELVQRSTSIDTEIKSLNRNLEVNNKKDTFPSTRLLDLSQTIAQKSSKKEALMKSIGEKTAILQKDDQERERIKSKESELKKLQEKLDKWSLLNKMIGAQTGNKFANFAQGLTLQNLLVYANKRLQKLSDRYLLDKPIKDGELTIIDQYQGNIQRSVSTLSGGESFLISLALALSLSDMASKNVNLESLFIDEGFGTLDQESLDIAMNTLEKLQTESQKTVGVISHVEALKERIHVQIKLDKNAQGYGSIKIEG